MVSRNYLLKKGAGPSGLKVSLDQRTIPTVINAAGAVEGILELVAVQVRRKPIALLAAAVGAGTLITLLIVPRRS